MSIIRNVISTPSSSLPNKQKNSTGKTSQQNFSKILSGYENSVGLQGTAGSQATRASQAGTKSKATKGISTRSSKAKTLEDYRLQASPSRHQIQRLKTSQTTGTQTAMTETKVPENLQQVIAESARRYDIPEKLLAAVIKAESNFNPRAVSSEGAKGLMQLMPATARSLGVKNVFDIQQNVDAGSRYLREMLDRYDGKLDLALAAYNAGPGAVDRYGGIPPYRETKGYVKKVMASC